MHACNEAVDSILAELTVQRAAVAAEAKKKAEEEAQRRKIREQQEQEARDLTARLRELQEVGVGIDADVKKGNNVDIPSDDDDDVIAHNPVRRNILASLLHGPLIFGL